MLLPEGSLSEPDPSTPSPSSLLLEMSALYSAPFLALLLAVFFSLRLRARRFFLLTAPVATAVPALGPGRRFTRQRIRGEAITLRSGDRDECFQNDRIGINDLGFCEPGPALMPGQKRLNALLPWLDPCCRPRDRCLSPIHQPLRPVRCPPCLGACGAGQLRMLPSCVH